MKKIITAFLLITGCIAGFSQNQQTNPNQPANPNQQQETRPAPVGPVTTPAQPVFRNMKTFTQDAVFQIPKGTTQVMIEAWGAGGGGNNTAGGGGGAYGKTVFSIIDGGSVNINIGNGGRGGTLMAVPGGNTSVHFRGAMVGATGVLFTVEGGKAATYATGSAGGSADPGSGGGGAYVNGGAAGYNSVCGQDGQTYIDEYQQTAQNTFIVTRYTGNGGNAGNTSYTGGRGDVGVNPAAPTYRRNGTEGKMPGGGGGGSLRQIGGYKGADGMAIIYY